MQPPRAVLLDAGGTLIHIDRSLILDALNAAGVLTGDADYDAARRGARDAVDVLLRSPNPSDDAGRARIYFETLLAALGCPAERAEEVGAVVAAHGAAGRLWTETLPGTLEVLRELRAEGLGLGVISNADGRVAQFLAAAGFDGLLDFVLDSHRVGIEKPDPRIFLLGCERAAVAPHQAVYVGDVFEVDVAGARAAGIEAILLTDEPRPDVTCIASLSELPAALGLRAARTS